MNDYYVYFYENPIDNKVFYIGKGKGNRLYVHLHDSSLRKNNKHKNELIKYIISLNLKPIIYKVSENLLESEAIKIEKYWISHFGISNLTNEKSFDSCIRSWKMSKEAIENVRKSKIGKLNPNFGKKRSEETIKKFIISTSGENHYNFGKKRSEETKFKISKKLKGISKCDSFKTSVSEKMSKKWADGSFKRKSFKGEDNPRFIHIDKDTIDIILSKYEEGFQIKQISDYLKISKVKISKVLKDNNISIKRNRKIYDKREN